MTEITEAVLIRQVAEYIISAGGKRMRPALVLLSARACGYSGVRHHELAAVVEFIHTATLLHDDVVDESSLRRGRATANAIFGNAATVLVGDFLYSRAFQMMVSVNRLRVLEVLADATNVIAEGEVLQLMNMHDPDLSVEDYLQVIRFKTAKLFEAANRVVDDGNGRVFQRSHQIGVCIGIAGLAQSFDRLAAHFVIRILQTGKVGFNRLRSTLGHKRTASQRCTIQ